MADVPGWEKVQPILDDPAVSDDQKRELTLAYSLANSDVSPPDEINPYLNKYDDGWWRTTGEGFNVGDSGENLREKFDVAKQSSDRAAGEQKQHNDAVEDGKGKLERSRSSGRHGAHGGAGVSNSDELLDAGKPGLRFFRTFVPLYHAIQNDTNDKSKVPQVKQIRDRYDEQRGINFEKFASVSRSLAEAGSAGRGSREDVASTLGQLGQSWQGQAADAARSFFSEQFAPTADDRVIAKANGAASAVEDALNAVSELVRAKAEAMLEVDSEGGKVAGKAPSDWETTIQVANHTDDDTTLRKACSIWGVPIDEECGDLTESEDGQRGAKDKIINECRRMVRESFAKTVEQHCEDFDKLCEDTKNKVDEAWGKLNEALGEAEQDPFQRPGPEQQGGGDQQGQQAGGSPGAGSPGGGAAGGGAAGGGSPSAGGGAAAGGAAGGGMPVSGGGSPGGPSGAAESPAVEAPPPGGPESGAAAQGSLGGPGQNSFGSVSGQIPDAGGDPAAGGSAAGGGGGSAGGGAAGGSTAASAGGGAGGGAPAAGGQPDLAPGGQSGSGGAPQQSPQSTAPAGAPGGAAGGGQGGAQGGGMMGGMAGMGGMGSGTGGDQQRNNDSPWRTEGQLFDDGVDPSPVRHRAVIGDDGEGEEE